MKPGRRSTVVSRLPIVIGVLVLFAILAPASSVRAQADPAAAAPTADAPKPGEPVGKDPERPRQPFAAPAADAGHGQAPAHGGEGGEGEAAKSEGGPGSGWVPPTWAISGFVAFLLGIAIIPLAAPRFWEPNKNKALFTALLGIPFGIYVIAYDWFALFKSLHEYVQFIILLFSLFVISGGIWLSGDIRSTPKNNAIFLIIGALLASFIGTTGACMLLIRPLLTSNHERKYVKHTVIFFIFIVANIGGSLTPLGDPPLFLGYLRGVPFLWTLQLWKLWLPTCAGLIALYYIMDSYFWKKESEETKKWDLEHVKPLSIKGGFNFVLLLGVILAIFFNPYLSKFIEHQFGAAAAEWAPVREVLMLLMAFISWKTTKMDFRKAQNFTFGPIVEVAVLFLGIFVTMIPALLILYDWGPRSPIQQPWHFFWAAGGLSSFLDNAPTYLTYLSLGLGQGAPEGVAAVQVSGGAIKEITLLAVSAGAVFMGANTYIGNAPNFMVKSIAEENKVKMPSFFGYMAWSLCILEPIFVIITFLVFV